MKRFYLFFILFICLFIFGCKSTKNSEKSSGEENNTQVDNSDYVVVTFDTDGGSIVESQKVKKGTNVIKPADPTRENYDFDSWYVGDEKWSFNGYVVTKDIVLTAKWIPLYDFKELNGNEVEITGFKNKSVVSLTISDKIGQKKIKIPNLIGYGPSYYALLFHIVSSKKLLRSTLMKIHPKLPK